MSASLWSRIAAGSLAAGAGLASVSYADDMSKYFDPEALERGAKAVREINQSPHAKKILEQVRAQEATKQAELKTKEAEFKAEAEKLGIEHEKVRWEEQRRAMAQDSQAKAQLAQYQDELARKRAEAEHDKQRARNAELVALQEESGRRSEEDRARVAAQIEAERRATERYRAELEKGVQRERALAEAEGRALEARQNADLRREELATTLKAQGERLVKGIDAALSNVGSAADALLADRDKLLALAGGASLLALGVYGSREGARVAGSAAERWFGTPRLVRETSRRGLLGRSRAAGPPRGAEATSRNFKDIVLQPALGEHVKALAAATSNTRRNNAPFRHMLFYGPPGTGKTMAAKRLARTSGLDYAILSGGDVAPLGGGAVTQLHELFDWAERSRRGLLLFVDEADAFLAKRGAGMSEGMRGALNATLFRTGDQSRDFVVVLATNRPSDLDPAVLDRMDEALEFALPGEAERAGILDIYFEQYILAAGTGRGVKAFARLAAFMRGRKAVESAIVVQGVSAADLARAAKRMEGFSGRELAKFMASVQAAVFGAKDATLTRELFDRVVDLKVREHAARKAFVEE